MDQKEKSDFSNLIKFVTMRKTLITFSAIFSALASIASFIPYIAIYYIIKEIILIYPNINLLNSENVINLGWIAFGGVVLNILLYFIALACSHLAAFSTLYQLKINFAKHIAKLPLGFHINYGSGKLRKIMDENIEKIELFIAHQFPDLIASIVAPIVMITILLTFDWRLGLAALFGIIIAFFIQMKAYGGSGAKKMMDKYQAALEEMNNSSVEYVRGISVIKAFKQTVHSFKKLRETIKSYTNFVIPYTLSWENFMSSFFTVINNIYIFVIPVGILIGFNTDNYQNYALNFIFYLIFVPSISTILMKSLYVTSTVMQISGGVSKMESVLNQKPLPNSFSSEFKFKNGDVIFKDVIFSYDNGGKKALNSISFEAKKGEITAIVGPSGGGKSTIAHLIPRFYDIDSGEILLGETNLKKIPLKILMENISFVFQDIFLFKQTIMENIKIGNKNSTEKEVIEAAKAARAHDFIMKLPKGYNTIIGTKGVHLSGGEQQRISIARALLKNAPIVVLDEATAFTDPENEYLIQLAFEKLMKNKTVILIAHRLSTIKGANKIIVVENGEIIEKGDHESLLNYNQKYKKLWDLYTDTINWKIGG